MHMAPSNVLPCPERTVLAQTMSDVPHSNHCLLRPKADMYAALHNRYVCSVMQQTCLMCATADMSAV